MKNITLVWLVVFAIAFNLPVQSQTTKPAKKTTAATAVSKQGGLPVLRAYKKTGQKGVLTEDVIVLPPVTMDSSTSRTVVQAAPEYIKLGANSIPLYVQALSRTALETFNTLSNGSCGTVECTDWMQGISIILAQEGTSLFLYYQPVRFCAVGPRRPDGPYFVRDYNLCSRGAFYYYDGTSFDEVNTPIEVNQKNNRINLYQSNTSPYGVSVKNPETFAFDYFRRGTGDEDPTGFAREIIYPVSELIQMAANGSVKLWNMVEAQTYDHTLYYKHNILLSTPNVTATGNVLSIPTTASFADLSHICPPRCSDEQFMFHIQ